MQMNYFIAALFFALIATVLAAKIPHITEKDPGDANYYHGIDLSQPCSAAGFNCMVRNNFHFAIIRCYQSLGRVDPNCVNSVKAAWAGGMSYVDVYVFPCPTCGNGKKQIEDTVHTLRSHNATIGMLWLDIEGTQYWHRDQASNRAFFNELLAGISSTGVHAGVYTSKSQWEPIMGSFTAGSHFDLWYAHYQSPPNPSMSDFVPFGGWGKAAIKQYQGSTSMCGCGVDLNAY